jgi:ankyrin repeat protein
MSAQLMALVLMATADSAVTAGAIHKAAEVGDVARVREILAADANAIHAFDRHHRTVLHVAVENGHLELVQLLLANGADVNACDYQKYTPLHLVGNPRIARELLRHKPDLEARTGDTGPTPLEYAAWEVARYSGSDATAKLATNWREIAGLLLDAGADFTMEAAVELNNIGRAKELLKADPQLANVPRNGHEEPLRLAARAGYLRMCQLLLEYHADAGGNGRGHRWLPGNWPSRAFPILVDAMPHTAVVKVLLDAGAKADQIVPGPFCVTCELGVGPNASLLHYAANAESVESAKLLLAKSADVHAADIWGQTALHIAAQRHHVDMVKLLLEHGAEVNAKDWAGKTPLGCADIFGRGKEVADELRRWGGKE